MELEEGGANAAVPAGALQTQAEHKPKQKKAATKHSKNCL